MSAEKRLWDLWRVKPANATGKLAILVSVLKLKMPWWNKIHALAILLRK